MPPTRDPAVIGILALQGDVSEHEHMLRRLGARVRLVKMPKDVVGLDGIILPGGESTTIGKLLRRFHLLEPLQSAVRAGLPMYGTCAGMILLADEVLRPAQDQPGIGGMDIAVERNAFGSQIESFEADVEVDGMAGGPFHGVFIRAPVIRRAGDSVEVLARLTDNTPVAARQGHMLVSSFHPELTQDARMHVLFLDRALSGRPAEAVHADHPMAAEAHL